MTFRRLRVLGGFACLLLASGCATVPGKGDPRDPLEGYNRTVYKFNDTLDRAVLKPIARGYDFVLPAPVKTGIRNFFSNLNDVVVFVNDFLQGKGKDGLSDTGRFLVNTTAGIGGLIDVATPLGLPKHNEDFGQTLGKWGVGSGPFFMIPFLGPSTVRDAPARLVDSQLQYTTQLHDVGWRNSLYGLEVIDTRAGLLSAGNVLGTAALDEYAFFRDAWLQRRRMLVYDGNPPKSNDESEDDYEEEPEAPAAAKPSGK